MTSIIISCGIFRVVYHSRSYIDVVSSVALKSMNAAVEEAKANPEYPSKGEVQCTCMLYNCKICAMMLQIILL